MSQHYRDVFITFSPNGTASTITATLGDQSDIGKFRKMIFKQITIPMTFYAISNINSQFAFIEKGADNSTNTQIKTIPDGNYTASTFAAAVQTQINSNAGFSHYNAQYFIEIDNATNRLVITTSVTGDSAGFQIAFYSGVGGTTNTPSKRIQAEKIWGVPATKLTSPVPTQPQIGNGTYLTSYRSTNPSQIWGPDQLLVVSPTLQNIFSRKNTDLGMNIQNIIMRVPVTVPLFSQQTFSDSNNEVAVQNNQSFPQKIVIDVTDETGNSLNFNGCVVYMHITVGNL